MSTGSTTQPAPGGPGTPPARRFLPRLRDARIRSKLALILAVPVIAVLGLAGLRLVDVGRHAYDADLVRDLTGLSSQVSDLGHQLHKERMAAAAYLAVADAPADPFRAQVGSTDTRISAYTTRRNAITDVPGALAARLHRIDEDLRTLDTTRKAVLARDGLAVSGVVLRYGVVITDLVGYGDVLGQFVGEGAIADQVRALSAFTKAKAGTAEQEAVAFAALTGGTLSEEQYASFLATQTGVQESLLSFSLNASPAQRSLVDRTVTGDAVVLADRTTTAINRSVRGTVDVSAADAARAIGAVTDLMRWAEVQLHTRLLDDAERASVTVTRRATLEAVIVLITLILAVVLAVALARSLNGSLRQLREGALAVANRDLPDAVARLRDVRNLGDGGAGDILRQVRDPIRLTGRDEVGQVAQAFNVVHKEAVRIAAEQAALRTSVSAMFLNLARRSQALVDRMIGELDQIERGEEDPKRLAQLFELDHLATRMRRNDENLLVLAGADSSAPRREDALLIDALRAAQSEVELYNRIEFGTVDADVSITALAVNDVVRLVAELLDNATRFSPPNTVVVAEGRRVRDQVVIQIEDRGLGMSAEQMATLNGRLAQPPGVDVAAFRLMGLAVVGRLASRYAVHVELSPNDEGGTIARVTLPNSIVVLPSRTAEPVGVGARTVPAAESAARPAAARSRTATLPAVASPAWAVEERTPDPQPVPLAGSHSALTAPTHHFGDSAAEPTVAYPTLEPTAPQPPGSPPRPGTPAPTTGAPAAGTGLRAADVRLRTADVEFGGAGPRPPDGDPRAADGDPRADEDAGAANRRPAGWGAALAALPAPPPPPAVVVEERTEAPIFREMEAHWFRDVEPGSEEWSMPTAGYAPPPAPSARGGSGPATPTSATPTSATPTSGSPAAAAAAADPDRTGPATGSPSSGLPATSGVDRPALPLRTPGATVLPPARTGSSPDGGTASDRAADPGSDLASDHGPAADLSPQPGPPHDPTPAPAGDPTAAPAGHPTAAPARDPGSVSASDRAGAPAPDPVAAPRPSAAPVSPGPRIPRQRTSPEQSWRTAADEGWTRAMAAADPATAGTTRSGLPKRVPQAQLVPGGVRPRSREHTRRTPDEVRGLLSAYHRGVQRGRTAGSAEADQAGTGPTKEMEQ